MRQIGQAIVTQLELGGKSCFIEATSREVCQTIVG